MSRQSLVFQYLRVHRLATTSLTLLVPAAAITLLALALPLRAQTGPVPAKGARVRVVVPASGARPEQRIEGDLMRLSGDTAVLSTSRVGSRTAVFQLGDSAGRRLEQLVVNRSNRTTAVLLGILAGGAGGTLIGSSIECSGFLCEAEQGGIGLLFGAMLGAGIGLEVGKSERWRPVSTAGVRLAITPKGPGVRITF